MVARSDSLNTSNIQVQSNSTVQVDWKNTIAHGGENHGDSVLDTVETTPAPIKNKIVPVTEIKPVKSSQTEFPATLPAVLPETPVSSKSQSVAQYPNTSQQSSSISKLIDACANGVPLKNFTQDEQTAIKQEYANFGEDLADVDVSSPFTSQLPIIVKSNQTPSAPASIPANGNQTTPVTGQDNGKVPVSANATPLNTDPRYVFNRATAPTGDGMYNVYDINKPNNGAEKGKVLIDHALPKVPVGAHKKGEWFNKDKDGNFDGMYNMDDKTIYVEGEKQLKSEYKQTVSANGQTQTINWNGIPKTPVADFPIKPGTKAYNYDRNPNEHKTQDLSFSFPTNPKVNTKSTPLTMGIIGVLKDGSTLFAAIDEKGEGAPANEILGKDERHTAQGGYTHAHFVNPSLWKDDPSGIVGTATDGFSITGPGSGKDELFTKDLDANHGKYGRYKNNEGKWVYGYHYVATRDFPYTIGAFAGIPSKVEGYTPPSPPQGAPMGMPQGNVPPK